jgi:hypothetical protein
MPAPLPYQPSLYCVVVRGATHTRMRRGRNFVMVTIRTERICDVVGRETLLDKAYGPSRFTKTSERLREGRQPAKQLAFVAVEHGQLVGTVRL